MSKTQKAGKKERAQKSEPIVVAQIMGKWVGGGVESVIMNYYRHIDRDKVQFDFICDEDSTNIPYDEIENLGGHVILCPPYQKLAKYLKFLKQLFREKKYRIVHSNINTLSVFPLYAAKKAGVPVRIAHSHSTSNPREWKKNLMKNALRPFSKVWATDYFACSELAGRYLFGDKAFDRGEVKIIWNAIDVEKFKFDPEARKKLRKEIGIADDDFVIGHIGRFVEQKNHSFLIDVFAEVKKKKKNAKLVLVGQGPLREEIEQKVKDLGLEKDVFLLGQRSDTNKLYSVFDVFCLPSLYEGLPVVGVEAQANGVPCVFSDRIAGEAVVNRNVEFVGIENARKVAEVITSNIKRIGIENYPLDIKNRTKEIEDFYYSKNKPVILHIVGSNIFSGLEKVVIKIIKNLENDFDFYYVTKPGKIEEVLKRENIKHKLIKKVSISEIRRVIKGTKPALIHAHDYRASCMGALATSNVPVISHLHANPLWIKKINVQSLLYAFCAKKFKKILLVSNVIEEEFVFKNHLKGKTKCVSNPFSAEEIRDKAGPTNKKEYDICCVGRLAEPKDPFMFCDIIASLKKDYPNIKAVWVGDGPYRESVENILIEKDLKNNIELTGFQENPYIYMAKSKIFVLPTKWEGFGLSVLEAMSLGLPCVVSNVGSLRRTLSNQKNGLACSEKEFIGKIKSTIASERYIEFAQMSKKIASKYSNADYYNTVREEYAQ